MKRILILLSVLLASSCVQDKEVPYEEKKVGYFILTEGFFNYNKQTYYSNGKDVICAIQSEEEVYQIAATRDIKLDANSFIPIESMPSGQRVLNHCDKNALW